MWGQTTTRSINAIFSLKSYLPFDVLPAWRRAARACRSTSRSGASPIRRRAGSWSPSEARMKPRDNVFQGGGAATTDPRKPDYDNLYAMQRRRLERSDRRAAGGAARHSTRSR